MDAKRVGRRTEIDVAKGLAMFLVVYGHVLHVDAKVSYWIYMFHMPAFFFLSGMTFNPWKYDSLRLFLKDKWKRRMVPYFIITAAGLIICLLWPGYRQPIQDRGWKSMLFWIFYFGQPQELYVGQIWFLTALFMAELIAYLWFRVFEKRTAGVKALSLLILAWAGMEVAKLKGLIPVTGRLPWKTDVALCAAVFLIGGYYSVKFCIWERLKGAEWFWMPLCLWLSYYYGPKWYGYVNMCRCIYPPGPYYYPVAFLGTAAVLLLAMVLKNSRFWQYCGRYSLQLFAIQTFVIYWVVEGIELLTGRVFVPMQEIGLWNSLWISVVVFALMVVMVYPWHYWKTVRPRQKADMQS